MPDEIKIRRATADDLSEILDLFAGSVKQIGRQNYDSEQIAVWAASVHNELRWQRAISDQYFLVAVSRVTIVGFGSLERAYLDFLYVHKDHQRKGIANLLYQALEKEAAHAGHRQITTDASKTARGFFARQGFDLVKENRKQIKGVELINYQMKKAL